MDSGVSCCTDSTVLLIEVVDAFVPEASEDFPTFVIGAVIDNHQFPVLVGLLQHRFDSSLQKLTAVESWNDDTDQ